MKRILLSGVAATVVLTGCGDPGRFAKQPAPLPTATGSVATVAPKPLPVPGTLAVNQAGAQPTSTLWYLRIESVAAESLFEGVYPGRPIAQSRLLEPGEYRVIAWHRRCSTICPSTGEAGLGPLEQVCGAKITITPRTRTAVTVAVDKEGVCAMKVS